MNADKFIAQWTRAPWLRMAHISRYSSLPVHHSESVAEHTFFVALLSYAMALAIYLEDGIQFRAEILLSRAIAHDLDEALTGDFIRPFKHSNPELKLLLHHQAQVGMELALEGLPGGNTFLTHWLCAKEDDYEGAIIQLADLWSCLIFARRELQMGNAFGERVTHGVGVWFQRFANTEGRPPSLQALARALAVQAEHAHEYARSEANDDMADPYLTSLLEGKPI